MSVVTYEGRVEHGQIHLKDAVDLPEGAQVYVVVPHIAGTALDPDPAQIAADVQTGLDDLVAGRVFEIQTADDLTRLVKEIEANETQWGQPRR